MGAPRGEGQGLCVFLPEHALLGAVQQRGQKQQVGHPHLPVPLQGKGVEHPPVDENPLSRSQQVLLPVDLGPHLPLLHKSDFPFVMPVPGIAFPSPPVVVPVPGAGEGLVPVLTGFFQVFPNGFPQLIGVHGWFPVHGAASFFHKTWRFCYRIPHLFDRSKAQDLLQ